MIKLLLSVIGVGVIIAIIAITAEAITEAKLMEWDEKTIIRKEKEDDH